MRELKIVPIDVDAILEEAGFGGVGVKSKKALATAIEKTIVGIRAEMVAVVASDIADLDKLKADVCEQKAALEAERTVLEADKLAFASFKKQVLASDTALRNALSFISDAKSAMNTRNIPEGITEGPSDALKCDHCGSRKDVWGRTVLFPNGDFKIIDLCAPCNKKMRVWGQSSNVLKQQSRKVRFYK